MLKFLLSFVSFAFFGSVLALGLSRCTSEPRLRMPALGEKIDIFPMAVNQTPPQGPVQTRGLKLNVMWGGRPLSGQKGHPTLRFYNQGGELVASYKWEDLETAYRDTGCSSGQIRSLDSYLQGNALICDGSVKLDGVARIEGVEDKGEIRSATSWAIYRLDEDVTSVSIGLY